MILELQNLNYYYLTYNNSLRKKHINEEFINYKLHEVNPLNHESKIKSGATGYLKMLDLATRNQDRNKKFQPFVCLEDDVKKYREFPEYLEIPDDTDLLYIGLSIFGKLVNTNEGIYDKVIYDNVNDDIIKLYNMLSSHGIIVCSNSGLLALQKSLLEDYYTDTVGYDVTLAKIQPFYNIYALRKPLVYQYGNIGGMENFTDIEYVSEKKNNIDNQDYLDYNCLSVKLCQLGSYH